MSRESWILAIDFSLASAGLLSSAYLVKVLFVAIVRGEIPVGRKTAKRTADPYAYWYLVICVVAFLFLVVPTCISMLMRLSADAG